MPIFIPQRTYWVASSGGIKSLANNGSDEYLGSDDRRERRQFIIANLDTVSTIYITLQSGTILFAVRKNETLTFENGQALKVYNNSGAAVNYTFAELYLDNSLQERAGPNGENAEGGGGFQQSGARGYVPRTAFGAALVRRFG